MRVFPLVVIQNPVLLQVLHLIRMGNDRFNGCCVENGDEREREGERERKGGKETLNVCVSHIIQCMLQHLPNEQYTLMHSAAGVNQCMHAESISHFSVSEQYICSVE